MRVTVGFTQITKMTSISLNYISDIRIDSMSIGAENYITSEDIMKIKSEVRRYLLVNLKYIMVPRTTATLEVKVLHRTSFTDEGIKTTRQYIINEIE